MGRHLVRIGALLIVLVSLAASFPGPVSAMPLHGAVNYGAGLSPNSVAVGDFNGDGKQDLAVANYDFLKVYILLGRGDGTFDAAVSYATGSAPWCVAVGDFNGDGRQDLALPINSGQASIMIGKGDGTFYAPVNYAVGTDPYYISVGDFNRDGKQDLAVANDADDDVSILIGRGDGTFNAAVDYGAGDQPWALAVGDFNGDGRQDLAVVNATSQNVSILIGRGDGTFNAAVNSAISGIPESVAIADFNGDGKQDLAVGNMDGNNVFILTGNGDGTFNAPVSYVAGSRPSSLTVGDFNGDYKWDLAVANWSANSISILIGKGDGTFNSAVNYGVGAGPLSVAVGDFNRDGAADVATANYQAPGSVSVLLNTSPVPVITNISPGEGTQGQTLDNIIIKGSGLLSASSISFGEDIEVNSFTVNSSTQITVSISIARKAARGGRTISVTTLGGEAIRAGGFKVKESLLSLDELSPHGSSTPAAPQGPVALSNIQVKTASLSPTKVAPGNPVTVTADVANSGPVNGSTRLTLYVNGREETSQGVTVSSGSNTPVSFTVARNEPGTYQVYVGGTNAGSFMVETVSETDAILYVSGALILFACVIGVIYAARKRQAAP